MCACRPYLRSVLVDSRETARCFFLVGGEYVNPPVRLVDSIDVQRPPLRVPDSWGNCDGISVCELGDVWFGNLHPPPTSHSQAGSIVKNFLSWMLQLCGADEHLDSGCYIGWTWCSVVYPKLFWLKARLLPLGKISSTLLGQPELFSPEDCLLIIDAVCDAGSIETGFSVYT